MFVLGIILLLIGLVMLLKPEFIWRIAESWKSADATEPSFFYTRSLRFGGIIVTIVGLASLLVSLLE